MSMPLPSRHPIRLEGEDVARLFPFYFAWDPSLRIVHFGPSLKKVCQDVAVGAPVAELFYRIHGQDPFIDPEQARFASDNLYLFQHLKSRVRFRGQLVHQAREGQVLMLCSPWLESTTELDQHDLTYQDFALHDATLDLLQILQTQHMANKDLLTLTGRLKEQRILLKAQEAETRKLALVAARTDNGVVVTDAKGRIEWINEGFTRITGYPLDEARGRTPGSLLQTDASNPSVIDYMRKSIRSGQAFRTEILNKHKTGRLYWLAIEAQPIHDEHGRLTNFMAIESDITQKKLDDQRRNLQYSVTRILSESGSVREASAKIIRSVCLQLGWIAGAAWAVNPRESVLELADLWHEPERNIHPFEAATRAIRFKRGIGLPGRTWASEKSQWIKDVVSDLNFPRANAALSAGLHAAFAFPILSQGTVLGVMEFFSSSITEPDDGLLQVMHGIGEQIGQFYSRKQAESELRESEALQRAIFASATYSIIATDTQGVIRVFNQTAEKWLGYRAEEMIGKQTPAVFHLKEEVTMRAALLSEELGRKVEPGFDTFVAKAALGRPDLQEWTYVRKDGSYFPVQLAVTALFYSSGVKSGYLGVASDITEQRRNSALLVAAKEEAEKANRAKGEFLAAKTHEIRTPINGIIGMSSLLMSTQLDASQREMTNAIRTSGEALMTIIDDILDFLQNQSSAP